MASHLKELSFHKLCKEELSDDASFKNVFAEIKRFSCIYHDSDQNDETI